MRSKRLKRIIFVGILAAVMLTAACFLVFSLVEGNRLYARLAGDWASHWPFSRGKGIPVRAYSVLSSAGVARPIAVEIEPRVTLLLNPVDLIDQFLLLSGDWEPEVRDWIASHLHPGGSFIDVGAHMGVHTLRAAKRVGSRAP